MYYYSGSMYLKNMTKQQVKAYRAYGAQISRCNRKSNNQYKNYGGKGIKVYYKLREFMGWYLFNMKESNIPLNEMSVGRIDHSKGYCFGNIEIQSLSENTRERLLRNPTIFYGKDHAKSIPIAAYCLKTKKKIMEFECMRDAGKYFGCHHYTVSRKIAKPTTKSKKIPYLLKLV